VHAYKVSHQILVHYFKTKYSKALRLFRKASNIKDRQQTGKVNKRKKQRLYKEQKNNYSILREKYCTHETRQYYGKRTVLL